MRGVRSTRILVRPVARRSSRASTTVRTARYVHGGLKVGSFFPGPTGVTAAFGDSLLSLVGGDYKGAAIGLGITVLAIAIPPAVLKIGAAAARGSNIVYRGLAAGENSAAGLVARAPGIGNSPASHVAGARASQWISTTRSTEVATSRFGQNGVVAIDLNKVPGTVVDLTRGIPGLSPNTMLSRWAINAQKVLILDSVPARAIVGGP